MEEHSEYNTWPAAACPALHAMYHRAAEPFISFTQHSRAKIWSIVGPFSPGSCLSQWPGAQGKGVKRQGGKALPAAAREPSSCWQLDAATCPQEAFISTYSCGYMQGCNQHILEAIYNFLLHCMRKLVLQLNHGRKKSLFFFFFTILNLPPPNTEKKNCPLFFTLAALGSASTCHKISCSLPHSLCTLLSTTGKKFCMFPHSLSNTCQMGYILARVSWKHRHSSINTRYF